jgi:hypothetical protein
MQKTNIYILATALAVTYAGAASAQSSSVTTNGTTTILRPVTITKTADLAFARVVKPTTGSGTVTLTASSDTVGVTGTGTLAAGTASRAKYTINGEGGQVVAVTVPASFDMSDGSSHTLTVTLSSDLSGGTVTLDQTIGTAGAAALNVGGSFPVSSTTTPAAYTGTFDVSVAYQ